MPLGGALVLAATALRAAAAVLGWGGIALAAAAVLWCLAYGVLLWRVGPGLWRPRTDGRDGCDGPAP